MTDELRDELNEQTLQMLAKMMKDNKSTLVFAVVVDSEGKNTNMLGYQVGPMQIIMAVKELMDALKNLPDNIKKMTDGN